MAKRKGAGADSSGSSKKARIGQSTAHWSKRHAGKRKAKESLKPGDAGIWATCEKGKEPQCVVELRDILQEYADKVSGEPASITCDIDDAQNIEEGNDSNVDIEAAIRNEVKELKRPGSKALIAAVRIDVQCLVFFKIRAPLDPVSLAGRICRDLSSGAGPKQSRFIKRLTPVRLLGRASEAGLHEVATQVLAPHFHRPENGTKKFAIRPTIRNNHQLKRDFVIKRVAAAVGPGHVVDLTNYDLMIIVDVFQDVCGMSVVPSDYDQLKRYNLAEIQASSTRNAGDHAEAAADAHASLAVHGVNLAPAREGIAPLATVLDERSQAPSVEGHPCPTRSHPITEGQA